jgi:UDP-2-acetamido-2-deoxy-ribo-hexuluronate aminotransferase
MKHLILDVNIVVDACTNRSSSVESVAAIAKAKAAGVALWVYTGSVQTLEFVLAGELVRLNAKNDFPPLTRAHAARRARLLLANFCNKTSWLAALSFEGNVFNTDDPEDEQLLLALERFPAGTAKLLTNDKQMLKKSPETTVTPSVWLAEKNQAASIDFIDLKTQQDFIRPNLEVNIHRVLHHGQYIMGPEIKQLEEKLAEYVDTKHCITCANGTDALLMALMALDISPDDEVITVPYTWISTAEVIALLRAKPVFVDIRPDTFNLDPDLLEATITPRTKAIMPVGIYGQCADMTRINQIADKHGIPVIEDAAQCFGATHYGKKACNLSLIGCTSFFPSKPLGCYGDGGAIFTQDDALADKMCQIRIHGQKIKHQHPLVGINGRLDTLQAAILLAKFPSFQSEVDARARIGARYTSLLNDSFCHPSSVLCPLVVPGNTSVYAQYTILSPDRNRLSQSLKESGIPSVAYYTAPLHLQGAFADLGHKAGDFPVAEKVAAQCLSLPMSPYLTMKEQEKVADAIKG